MLAVIKVIYVQKVLLFSQQWIMCYSILYFKPSTEKNDSSVVIKRLNPEGLLGSYLCFLPFRSRVSFFSVDKKVNKGLFSPGEKIYIYFFLRLNLLILTFYGPLSFFPLMMLLSRINRFSITISCYFDRLSMSWIFAPFHEDCSRRLWTYKSAVG